MKHFSYQIEDEGDSFEVSFLLDGEKVGAALFPDGGTIDAFSMALEMGNKWETFGGVVVQMS